MDLKRCKGVHSVDLGESFRTAIYLQTLASIQLRTNPVKFACSPRTDPPGLSFALVRTKLQCSDGMAVRQILKAVRRKFHSDGEVNTSKEKWLYMSMFATNSSGTEIRNSLAGPACGT